MAVGSVISVEGFTFMMSPAAAGTVWKALLGQGAIHMSPSAWETFRILQGMKLIIIVLFLLICTPNFSAMLTDCNWFK